MSNTSSQIVQKLWNYCNVLRDDGLSYQDYLEQLTFLLFLKMADERAECRGRSRAHLPKAIAGQTSPDRRTARLDSHYRRTLEELGKTRRDAGASSSARRRTRSRTRPSCGGSSST